MTLETIPPTVDLHRHWEASLSPTHIALLAVRNHVTEFRGRDGNVIEGVDPQNPDSLANHMRSVAEGFKGDGGMLRFLNAFRAVGSVFRTPDDIVDAIAWQLLRDATAGSVHTELRGSPLSMTEVTGIPPEEVMQAVQRGIDRVAWRISATQIACFSREKGQTDLSDRFKYQAPEVVRAVVQMHCEDRPVGLDIAGKGEIDFPPRMFKDVFAPAREARVPITVHAGEQGYPPHFDGAPPSMIREAIELLGARRIGHGTSLLADPDLVTMVRERGIGIEACPVSNDLMGFMPLAEHPLRRMLDTGLLVSAGTDDPLFFGVDSVRAMFLQTHEVLGLTPLNVQQLTRNAIATAFVSEQKRAELMAQFEASL